MLKDLLADDFQYTVREQLVCNRSILDILTRHQECSARINRTIVKTITGCGCLKLDVKKNSLPEEASLSELSAVLDSHLSGSLCPNCKDMIEGEIGRSMVYMAALCNSLDINMFDIMIKEHNKMKLLRYL